MIIANNDLISATKTINCPFSDHEFVLACLNLPSNSYNTCDFYYARKLDDEKLALISNKFDSIDYSFLNDHDKNVDAKWMLLKENLLSLIDDIAPLYKLKVKNKTSNPWFDAELKQIKNQRDLAYLKFIKSRSNDDFNQLSHLKNQFNFLKKSKMIEYFKSRKTNDFKNHKKFWEFYSAFYTIKSAKDHNELPDSLKFNDVAVNGNEEVGNFFNIFLSCGHFALLFLG